MAVQSRGGALGLAWTRHKWSGDGKQRVRLRSKLELTDVGRFFGGYGFIVDWRMMISMIQFEKKGFRSTRTWIGRLQQSLVVSSSNGEVSKAAGAW